MRLNQYIARHSVHSRRRADELIRDGQVKLNGQPAQLADQVTDDDKVMIKGQVLKPTEAITIALHKPTGYVCSRRAQGSPTIYELLPVSYRNLKTVGRLDKDSSGLILLTNDGRLADQLSHPRHGKTKVYRVSLDQVLSPEDQKLLVSGVMLSDGLSRIGLKPLGSSGRSWQVSLKEGRNRQIRRSFDSLGYRVIGLQRVIFGPHKLGKLGPGQYRRLKLTS